MLINDVEHLLRDEGEITVRRAGVRLTLDLRHPHERRYAACAVLSLAYPQLDIDSLLTRHVIRPGDAVLDLGANIGVTALEFLAAGASRVVCVEPVRALVERLEALDDDRLTIIRGATGSRSGEIELTLSTAHNQGSSYSPGVMAMFPGVFGEGPVKETVPMVTVDVLPANCDVWKLDVEGAEIDTLIGARKALAEYPPRAIIAEIFDPFLDEVRSMLQPTHPVQRRAAIRRDDYSLALIEPDDFESEAYHQTSPMYLFQKDDG